ncbi:MAG: imidazole glycerol phosphate synthase subunit HisH [Actinomycetota bacterium]|nr:imidazole glycerol phosphate synthase subunit HisH [Actinomycetota bacterium]
MTGSRPRVVVLDYGSGNLRSAERAVARAGADVVVTADRDAALAADGLVVPGVGAFRTCANALRDAGGEEVVRTRLERDAPVLGICVGMQVLYEEGEEHGERTRGLGVLQGAVTGLDAPVLPHMGWNTVTAAPGSVLLDGFGAGERFYFVHSFAARPGADADPGLRESTAEHGERFTAVVERGALAATQFHPEKSGDAGRHLLENWVRSLR